MKGEAAFWANKNILFSNKLVWAQDDYAASISESDLGSVKAYVYVQETHHNHSSIEEKHELPNIDDD